MNVSLQKFLSAIPWKLLVLFDEAVQGLDQVGLSKHSISLSLTLPILPSRLL